MSQPSSDQKDRNFGFAIYYWMINLGAFLAPIGMQQVFGGDYRAYFVVSAGLSLLNLAICLVMWKDVRLPKPELRVGESLRGMKEITKHPAFMALILIYSGFWFMYAITTSFLQVYAVDYGIMTPENIALIVPANALAILLVGPVLSKVTGKFPSLGLMIAGMTIFCAGFLLIGFVPTIYALLAGVLIYSIGEFLTHPSYLSYVTKIAPADKLPVFLGYGFISVGVGQFFGTLLGGVFYGRFSDGMGKPQLFWVAVVSVGLITVAAFLVYNLVLSARAARRDAPPAAPTRARRAFGPAAALAVLAVLLVPGLFAAGALVPAQNALAPSSSLPDATDGLGETIALADVTGDTAAGATTWQDLAIPDDALGTLALTLTWRDEAAPNAASSNAPDTFRVHVENADGEMVAMSDEVANPQGSEGQITLQVPDVGPGVWRIGIELVEAGAVVMGAGPFTLPGTQQADPGNEWTLASAVERAA